MGVAASNAIKNERLAWPVGCFTKRCNSSALGLGVRVFRKSHADKSF